MNRNDFRNPLIQSGIVLLVVFLFISIVANSPAEGFFGSIFALVSGLIKGLLFVVALSIGLIFSIAVLVAIFIMAVSFHSVEKARLLFEQLKTGLVALYCKMRGCDNSPAPEAQVSAKPPAAAEQSIPPEVPEAVETTDQKPFEEESAQEAEARIALLEKQIGTIQSSLSSAEKQLTVLQSLADENQKAVLDQMVETLNSLETSSAELAARVQSQSEELAAAEERLSTLEKSGTPNLDELRQEIEALHKKTSVPEVVSGILAYIDTQEEREALTEKAEEAVSRGMTYAQTDEFFKKSLPVNVHKALADHPRLTKDFIRSIKKKFE